MHVNTTTHLRTFLTSAHVNFSRVAEDLSYQVSSESLHTPIQTSLLFPSHGDDHCDEPRHGATFGQMAEQNTLTGYEPNDLTEMNNTEVTPIFFHKPSVTSTYDSPPLESDLDDQQ